MASTLVPDESLLSDQLLRWEELHDRGQEVTVEDLCAGHPEQVGELRRRIAVLRAMADPLGTTTAASSAAVARPAADPPGTSRRATCTVHYDDLRFHAAGGLGEVFLARGDDLPRDVALKFVRLPYARDPESLRRFLREGELTGRLEHPGIVPVYGRGHDADGCPCYAMRFIRGRTLDAAIRDFHDADGPARADPSARSTAFRALLRRFAAVCNTVAHAHSRGVIHRDIKPSNILLGPFDETLLVDWGLAESFDPGPERPRTAASAEPRGGDDPDCTAPGSGSGSASAGPPTADVIGTPSFMSPEQAAGRADRVGSASDVYSLGATLYCLLTGRMPFQDGHVGVVLVKVLQGQFPPPRQVQPDVPRALEAICLKAMARRPEDRYASALDLVADLDRWLADEPVSVYREPLGQRVGRWARRHRPLVVGGAVLLVTAAVLSAMFAVAIGREQGRAEQARLQARATLHDANRMLAHVQQHLDGSMPSNLDQIRLELLSDVLRFNLESLRHWRDYPEIQGDVALAYRVVADIHQQLGGSHEAEGAYRRSIAILERLDKAYPHALVYRDELAASYHHLGHLLVSDGRADEAHRAYRHALDLEEGPIAARPTDPHFRLGRVTFLNSLGAALSDSGHSEQVGQGEVLLRRAVALGEPLLAEDGRTSEPRIVLVAALGNLGVLLNRTGRLPEAEATFRRALEVQAGLSPGAPEQPVRLQVQAGPDDVQVVYRWFMAITLRRLQVQAGLDDVQARILATKGQTAEADQRYRACLEAREAVAAAYPARLACQAELASVLTNYGLFLKAGGRLAEAEKLLGRALDLQTKLVAGAPRNTRYRLELVTTSNDLGNLLRALGRDQEAEAAYRRGLEYLAAAAGPTRGRPDYRSSVGMLLHDLADLTRAHGRSDNALELLRQAIDHQRAALEANPRDTFDRQALSDHYRVLAHTLLDAGRPRDAADAAEQLPGLFPDRPKEPYDAAGFLCRCIPLILNAPRLPAPERRALAETYARRAVRHLQAAVQHGYRDAENLRTAHSFDPLRERDDFRCLLEGLGRTGDKAP